VCAERARKAQGMIRVKRKREHTGEEGGGKVRHSGVMVQEVSSKAVRSIVRHFRKWCVEMRWVRST